MSAKVTAASWSMGKHFFRLGAVITDKNLSAKAIKEGVAVPFSEKEEKETETEKEKGKK